METILKFIIVCVVMSFFFFAARRGNFDKASRETTDAFGVGYDYGSVMHYSANAFSNNGQPTILAKVNCEFLC